ncbi:MAG: hypothetical protein AAGA54_07350 [Myxococcota bacterium]
MKLGLTVGGAALAVLAAGGCVNEASEFNAEAAERVCAYNERDPERPFLDRTREIPTAPDPFDQTDPLEGLGENPDYEPYGGPTREADVVRNLDRCNTRCTFSPRKGRRCLRALRRALRRDEYKDRAFAVCERVYSCPGNVKEPECRITTFNGCAVGSRQAPVSLLLLALVGMLRRRRL